MCKPSLYLFLAILVLCNCCIYENDETYFNNIQPPDGSDASITLESLNGSVLYKPVMVHLIVMPSGKQYYEAVVNVDGVNIYSSTSTSGEFWFRLDPANFQSGERKLRVNVIYPTLSRSLAGQLGAEIMTLNMEYAFTVDIIAPARIAAPVVSIEDGKSMLRWQKPEKFNFSELILLRSYYENGVYVAKDSIKITDFNTTVYHDASYVGGEVRYRVDMKGYNFYIQGEETSFNVKPISLRVDSLSTPVMIRWQRLPLYNNNILINNVHPPNEANGIPVHARFGQPGSATVTIRPVSPPQPGWPTYQREIRKDVFVGIKTNPFYMIEYVPSKNAYFLINNGTVYRLHAGTYEITGSLAIPGNQFSGLCFSHNGEHAYVYQYDKLYRLNLDGMYISETINLTAITGVPNQGFEYKPTVSDDNVVAFALYAMPKHVVDLNSKTVVWTKTGYGSPVISPDGQYLYWLGTIYKKQNGNWDNTYGTLAIGLGSINTPLFRQDTQHQVIIDKGASDGIFIYDLNTLQLVSKLSLIYTFRYDRHTQSFMTVPSYGYLGDIFVYDDSNTEKRKLEGVFEPEKVFYVNGHYFHTSGSILP
jgi:hypothetical protein